MLLLALLGATLSLAASTGDAHATIGLAGGASAPSTPATTSNTARPKIHPTALATWFGPGFYGKKTACGQVLTSLVVGVANRTLPCGTLVRVTYQDHSLTVPVIDRGPYGHLGADWDLTAGAAAALQITETVRIRAKIVGATANTPALGAPPSSPAAEATGGALAAPASST
jgi:rare lipoprotein A (peptidoglycan hydrolase)